MVLMTNKCSWLTLYNEEQENISSKFSGNSENFVKIAICIHSYIFDILKFYITYMCVIRSDRVHISVSKYYNYKVSIRLVIHIYVYMCLYRYVGVCFRVYVLNLTTKTCLWNLFKNKVPNLKCSATLVCGRTC